MIKRLWVNNFRSLADVTVDLEPVTVLAGHNGAGKSNLVNALEFLHDAFRLGLDTTVAQYGGMSMLRRWSPKGRPYDVEIGLLVETDELECSYTVALGSKRRGEYHVKKEAFQLCDVQGGGDSGFEATNGTWKTRPGELAPAIPSRSLVLPLVATSEPYSQLYDYVASLSFYDILPHSIREPQKSANPYPLGKDGANLASTLREMQTSQSPLLNPLREALRSVMPHIVDFEVNPVSGYLVTRLKRNMGNDAHALFDLALESEGTLRMLGILVALYQDTHRTLIALEEPEKTIHSGALGVLWEEIESATERSQILVTTHSPDLLDLCQADQIRVVEMVDGVTLIGGIEETQKRAVREHLFAPGQLLRAEGLQRARQDPLPL